jgi:predicted O-methyltransferase YrrM
MTPSLRPPDFYIQHKPWGWYQAPDQLAPLVEHCRSGERVKALEIGAFDGVSANSMLDLLFLHPESEVHTMDPYRPDPTTPEVSEQTRALFEENCRRGGNGERIHLYKGISAEVLAWMAATEGFWESFDFAFIDGSHLCADVFIDAAMTWHLLKPGAIMVFDDYNWMPEFPEPRRPRAAIDCFERCFAGRLARLWAGAQIGFLKLLP